MRKFILAVLFCLGLFVIHQRILSQEETVALPEPLPIADDAPVRPSPMIPMQLPQGTPGMSGGMVGGPLGPMDPVGFDPRAAAGARENLTRQYREISQFLAQVDPRDTQFIETLRQEQSLILEQLKGLEAQAAPAARTVGTGTMPDLDSLPAQWAGDPRQSQNMQISPEELARILAEAQQQTPMNRQFPSSIPPGGFPGGYQPAPFGATPAVPPRESFAVPSQVPGPMGMGMPSPWGTQQSSQEITELKGTISVLQQQIELMRDEIKALDAQMRLLNQNILLMNNAR